MASAAMAIFGLSDLLTPCTSMPGVDGEIIDTTLRMEEDDVEPLLDEERQRGSGYVQALGSNAVDSDRCEAPRLGGSSTRGQPHHDLEALATPPVELVATLPDNHVPGSRIRMSGPHGRVQVQSPPLAQPGERITYLLAPTPEYRIEVPPGAGPGAWIRFKRDDGVEVTVPVPKEKFSGDFFEVGPPALMVQVPIGALPGDFVRFRHSLGGRSDVEEAEWCRARVPQGLRPGDYFAARLPLPKPADKARPSFFELAMASL